MSFLANIFSKLVSGGGGLFSKIIGGVGNIGSKIGSVLSGGLKRVVSSPVISNVVQGVTGINPGNIAGNLSSFAGSIKSGDYLGALDKGLSGVDALSGAVDKTKKLFQRD